MCAGKKVVKSNCLATLNPNLAKEWHPSKNGNLTSSDVSKADTKKVWWKCSKADDHEWESTVANRSQGKGCPICAGRKVVLSNCLATTNPTLAKEWHPTKNGELTPSDTTGGNDKKVWWKCDKADDHEWEAVIHNRDRGIGCPYCRGYKAVKSNCLATLNPELAKEWHPTKNGDLTSYDVTISSNKKVWWKCDKVDDHEWEASPAVRTKNGCPCCSGFKIVLSNCLTTTHPNLAKEWHPIKNNHLTPFDVGAGSGVDVWWKCNKADDHEWRARIYSRSRSNGRTCPYCTLTPQSKQELIITFELKTIFKNIDPKGFKTRLDGKLRAIDIFIPLLKLAIEFDGNYWHKDKLALDKIKSEILMDKGYKVIRIREEPLKKIHENDIISTHPYGGKQITDNILKRILDLFILDSKTISRIKNYLEKDSLQNEKGLDKYIDQILREKAERK